MSTVDFKLNVDVITDLAAARILIAIIECLAYQRNQIPFAFHTFKYMIAKVRESLSNDDDWNTQILNRQKQLAINTFDAINEISANILTEFKKHTITEALLMFGATPFTPKETFHIKLPTVSPNHVAENHMGSLQKILNEVVMCIVTTEKLYSIISSHIGQTNVFVMLKKANDIVPVEEEEFFNIKEHFVVPKKCKTIEINIANEFKDVNCSLNSCCHGEMYVFRDAQAGIALTNNTEPAITGASTESDREFCWYESKINIKGYKDIIVKGKHIWDT